MRILYCSENYCPHDHRFLSAVSESGKHDVYWFRLEGGDRVQEERGIPKTVEVVGRKNSEQVNWSDYLRAKREFSRVIDEVKPDVIHAGPIQRVAFLSTLNDFHPLISMSWGFDLLQDAHRNLFWKAVTRFVLNRTDWLIADCHTVKDMAADFGYASENVTVFPWGVDQQIFSPKDRDGARKAVGFKNDLLIVHTRSWEPRYGVDVMLKALEQALIVQPNIQVLMLGGGSQEKEIKAFVQEKGITGHFHFKGYLSNERLVNYYRAADIYLSASHVDGSSVALLEAMSCGCVPIVSDISSNKEWVTDEVEGVTFKDSSIEDLTRKILLVAEQKDLLPIYRTNALLKVKENADWERGKAKLLDAYEQVIALGTK